MIKDVYVSNKAVIVILCHISVSGGRSFKGMECGVKVNDREEKQIPFPERRLQGDMVGDRSPGALRGVWPGRAVAGPVDRQGAQEREPFRVSGMSFVGSGGRCGRGRRGGSFS